MDENAQQLVRLAELMALSADVLRKLTKADSLVGEATKLNFVAYELEQLSAEVKRVGFSVPPP